jgi:hypothetical protein
MPVSLAQCTPAMERSSCPAVLEGKGMLPGKILQATATSSIKQQRVIKQQPVISNSKE